jgi:hypothetical protein
MNPAEAVAFMRLHNIEHLRLPDGLEITLGPDIIPPPKPDRVDGPDLNERGSGGMTRQEQIELFGQVYETDFQDKRA